MSKTENKPNEQTPAVKAKDTKPNLEALAVEQKVTPLTGKKVVAGKGGGVYLRNLETNLIIAGPIPLHLAEMTQRGNKKIEIVHDKETK